MTVGALRRRLVVGSLVLAACGRSATSPNDPRSLAGTWAPDAAELPGLTYTMTLTVTDTVVAGSGTWRFPIGPSGRVLVGGAAVDGTVRLRVIFVQASDTRTVVTDTSSVLPFLDERFDGRLPTGGRLAGQLVSDPLTGPFTYVRVGDP